jgi:hypothetical protein
MKTIVLLALLAVSGAAWSDDEGGFYLGAALGQASGACGESSPTVSCSEGDSAFKLAIGYQVNRNFGVELAYASLGSVTRRDARFAGNDTTQMSALEVSALGVWPLRGGLELQGRIGAYASGVSAQSDGGSSASSDGGGSSVTFGLGARYRVTERGLLRVEWQRYNAFSDGSRSMNIDTLTIGFLFMLAR